MSEELRELVAAVKEQLHWLDAKDAGMFTPEALMLQRADARVKIALARFLESIGEKA